MNDRRSYNNEGGYIALTAHSFTSSTYGNGNNNDHGPRRSYSNTEGSTGGRFGRRNNNNAGRYNDRRSDRPYRGRDNSYSRDGGE